MEKTNNKIENKPNKLKLDLDKIVSSVRSAYGKDKALALQVSTGNSITRPTKDSDFVHWKNSPWELLTGCKGCAFGKVTQVCGKSNSGKSTHGLAFMKQAQDQGVLVILADTEGKFSAQRFDNHFKGDSSKLITVSSRMILEFGDQIEKVIIAAKEQDSSCKILIVIDALGSALPRNEEEGSLLEGKQMASGSKENGAILRAIVRLMEKYKNRETNEETIALLLINTVYANIGSHGDVQAGGTKVEYFSSLIVQLTRVSDLTKVKDGIKRKIGIVTRARVKKNHLFDGIDDAIAELDLTITAGGIDVLSKQKIKKTEELENGDSAIEIGDE